MHFCPFSLRQKCPLSGALFVLKISPSSPIPTTMQKTVQCFRLKIHIQLLDPNISGRPTRAQFTKYRIFKTNNLYIERVYLILQRDEYVPIKVTDINFNEHRNRF